MEKIKESLCKDCCYSLVIDYSGSEESYCTLYSPPFFIGTSKVKECGNKMYKIELVTIDKPIQEDSDIFFGRTKKKPFSFAKTTNNVKSFFKTKALEE